MKSIVASVLIWLGFVAIAASTNPALSETVESLPGGNYWFEEAAASELGRSDRSVLFRKSGNTVIGFEVLPASERFCFRGVARQNRIVDITRAFPPYTPASRWEFSADEGIDLSGYLSSDRPFTEQDREMLQTCIQMFWR